MKKILFLLLCVASAAVSAQAPQGIPYQAIARNASGAAIASTAVKVRFSIRDSIATGPVRYQETHIPTTSALGLFSVNVGMGTVVTGTFSGINWGKNAKFLQVEMDPAGGTSYTDLGTTQMMSVPYALSAGSWTPTGSGYGEVKLYNCDGTIQFTPCIPKVTTLPVSAITTTTATAGGTMVSDGGSNYTARGVCWSTSPNPTIDLPTKIDASGLLTNFGSLNLTNLTSNTLYYVRAFVTNAVGTAYGNQVSFTTLPISTNPVDADGNVYSTVTIGSQVWMKENLRVSRYRNGDAISTGLSDAAWSSATIGAYSIYNNDPANNTTYGKLYNWYAVADSRGLCPAGWHVPSSEEWTILENYLGGYSSAGGKMKSTGTIESGTGLWYHPNTAATNSSSFSALPGGYRASGTFSGIGYYINIWTSTDYTSTIAFHVDQRFSESASYRIINPKAQGCSVRCIKD